MPNIHYMVRYHWNLYIWYEGVDKQEHIQNLQLQCDASCLMALESQFIHWIHPAPELERCLWCIKIANACCRSSRHC